MAADRAWYRDRVLLVELFVLSNLSFLALDIYIAHSVNFFGHRAEWIPFWFSCGATLVLGPTLLLQLFAGRDSLHRMAGFVVGALSILIGIAGVLFHLESQFFEEATIKNLVYTAPFAAPASYSGVGLLLLLNRMVAPSTDEWRRWVVFLACGGFVGNFLLTLCDHAQNGFFSLTEWIPVVSSAFAISFLILLIVSAYDRRLLLAGYVVVALQILVGVAGFGLHLSATLAAGDPNLFNRIVYGAPLFAPLLLPNIAMLAMIGMWGWGED